MMLRIKRVPTVVSNYQKDEADDTARRSAGCGKNCLKSCCIPGAKLPLYAFKKVSMEREEDVLKMENTESPVAFLDSLVLGEWEDRMQRGLFRYDVTACETKVIPGEYGFIAQLNEGRHLKKRPTEFRVDKVLQPFDGNKFNFTKVGQEEVLFQFEASEDGEVQFYPTAPIDVENSSSVVAINVSPIEYGHVLLIPRIFECLPQRIDRESFLLALHMAAEAGNPHFRLGYNSLGAFVSLSFSFFFIFSLVFQLWLEKEIMGKLIEEKALDQKLNGHQHRDRDHARQKPGLNNNYNNKSLEEKVSEFLYNDFAESDGNWVNDATTDGYGSDGNESNDSIQHTLYWESSRPCFSQHRFLTSDTGFHHPFFYVLISEQ